MHNALTNANSATEVRLNVAFPTGTRIRSI